jgi:sugar transferase (PEP-CTERM/EpsH1 system associated)
VADAALNQSFDLIFVHCSSAAQYARHIKRAISILDFGDMDSQKWLDFSRFRRFPLSVGYWLEGHKLMNAEMRLARQFDLCTCTTLAELETLDSLGAASRTAWFPNGVDSDYFAPTHVSTDENQICFVGRMDYYPNQQAMFYFCGDVWPMLKKRFPKLRLKIVGAEPSSEVSDLRQLDGVEVTGTVPDVRPHVMSSVLTIAPLAIARGTQNKILESMAMGVPVVCSAKASGGVNAVAGDHLMTADSPEEYLTAISGLLENPKRRMRLAAAARERVLSHHSWGSSMTKLDNIIGSLPLPGRATG